MADLNSTYHPYIHPIDIDALKREAMYDLFPDDSEIKQNMTKFFNELSELKAQQTVTANAVKVPYAGTTQADRVAFLKARIEAIYNRLDLIRAFVDGYKAQIIAAGGEPPIDTMATIGAVLAVIPFTAPVGAAAQLIAKLTNTKAENALYKQEKIQEGTSAIAGFAQDITQLQVIRQQFLTELQSIKTPADPDYFAPSAIPTWVYIVGAVALIAFLIWRKRRNRKRSRR